MTYGYFNATLLISLFLSPLKHQFHFTRRVGFAWWSVLGRPCHMDVGQAAGEGEKVWSNCLLGIWCASTTQVKSDCSSATSIFNYFRANCVSRLYMYRMDRCRSTPRHVFHSRAVISQLPSHASVAAARTATSWSQTSIISSPHSLWLPSKATPVPRVAESALYVSHTAYGRIHRQVRVPKDVHCTHSTQA